MTNQEHIYFEKLKEAITEVFNSNNGSSFKIQEWKGSMITSFQEDLFQKTKGRVSEKWFYTYCKKTPDKLPRIDTLNLLSVYSGYQSWTQRAGRFRSGAGSEPDDGIAGRSGPVIPVHQP